MTQLLKKCTACILLVYSWSVAVAQSSETPATNPPVESKRLLGIVPNYRSSPSLQNYQPLPPGDKFKIASEDAFDRGTVALAGIFGAEAQATNANRYFGQGQGSGWSRLGYASGQIFWTHTDSGGTEFNYSEIVGNSAAVAISNSYYADNRTARD